MSRTSSDQSQNELTIRAVILGVILAIIIASANAYLGLFSGQTVSASIPAAVVSMGILRIFRDNSILENNIVQTAASAGGSIAGGAIFTIPAFVLIGAWNDFHYWRVFVLCGMGGVLGVLFSVPLRRYFVVEQDLPFPEGTATAEVLQSSSSGKSFRILLLGALLGGLAKFCQVGFRFWDEAVSYATYIGHSAFYLGMDISAAVVAVGYIVGLNAGTVIFVSGFVAWTILIPFLTYFFREAPFVLALGPHPSAYHLAFTVWSAKVRYIGVGAMLSGAVWSLIHLVPALFGAIRRALADHKKLASQSALDKNFSVPDIEKDIPILWVLVLSVLALIPIFIIVYGIVHSVITSLVMAAMIVIAGFLFAAVAGYMAGIVGSSNNPISGVIICTTLLSAFLLVILLGGDHKGGAIATLMIAAVVCCAASAGSDTLQDIKAGRLLGATPWKQQMMMAVGVFFSVLTIAPVLNLLLHAYGIGVPTAAHPNPLSAPQATLIMSVAQGVWNNDLPWPMVISGVIIGILFAVLDFVAEKRHWSWKFPVLAVAIGIYLPLEVTSPLFLGALASFLVERRARRHGMHAETNRYGILFSAGLITGEAIIGIIVAIPIVLTGNTNVFALMDKPHWGGWPGLVVLLAIVVVLVRLSYRFYRQSASTNA